MIQSIRKILSNPLNNNNNNTNTKNTKQQQQQQNQFSLFMSRDSKSIGFVMEILLELIELNDKQSNEKDKQTNHDLKYEIDRWFQNFSSILSELIDSNLLFISEFVRTFTLKNLSANSSSFKLRLSITTLSLFLQRKEQTQKEWMFESINNEEDFICWLILRNLLELQFTKKNREILYSNDCLSQTLESIQIIQNTLITSKAMKKCKNKTKNGIFQFLFIFKHRYCFGR